MLTKLGVTEFDQPCGQLSGGQRKRLALVSVLLSPAEILLLDEPTNHLDNSMSDWLEDQLRRRKGAMIMVTHDRYFWTVSLTGSWNWTKGRFIPMMPIIPAIWN